MPWYIQIILAVFMVVLYIATFMGILTSPNSSDKRIFYSLGVGIFSALLLIFWIFQYSTYHTIIYWRIVELFK